MTILVDRAAEHGAEAKTGTIRAFVMTSLDQVGFMDKPVPSRVPTTPL